MGNWNDDLNCQKKRKTAVLTQEDAQDDLEEDAKTL